MRQALHHLATTTKGKGLYDMTRPVLDWVTRQDIATGLLTLFCRHTSASLLVQENADPSVREDLTAYFEGSHPRARPATPTTTRGPPHAGPSAHRADPDAA